MSWFAQVLEGARRQREPKLDVDGTFYRADDVRALLRQRDELVQEHEARVETMRESYEAEATRYQRALFEARGSGRYRDGVARGVRLVMEDPWWHTTQESLENLAKAIERGDFDPGTEKT